ncbi:hypothetical protein Q3G72_013748 [Acer saccharum]|nr:hypothetical protein Q3G72_013748 [Acer saccharum]
MRKTWVQLIHGASPTVVLSHHELLLLFLLRQLTQGFSGSSSTSPSSLKGKFSKAFQGRNGRAFLFSHAMNVVVGQKEDRHLLTGLHTVADISCADCREVLGWKYERAYEASQKYKEGKFILEKSKIVKENW